MTSTTIIITVTATIVLGGFFLFKKRSTNTSKTQSPIPVAHYNIDDAEKFVKRLTELGYFKYADPKDIDTLQKHMIKEYDPTNELVSIWDEHTPTPKDYRYYFCDN